LVQFIKKLGENVDLVCQNSLTVILPTLNERENLEYLIPQVLSLASIEHAPRISVLVVDDGSTDGSGEFVRSISSHDARVSLIERIGIASLPASISEGVNACNSDFVAWLDADGSMPISHLEKMWFSSRTHGYDLVIGSRFVKGGGFKGMNEVGKTTPIQFARNLKDSEDSFLAVILSRGLNYILRMTLPCGVHDLTSGFILVKRSSLLETKIEGAYGDYCPSLIYELVKKNLRTVELGYVCLPRRFGSSKTGANLIDYIKRGLPYITRSVKTRLRYSL
jgi:dolichol-phosphate mannosyltransferase